MIPGFGSPGSLKPLDLPPCPCLLLVFSLSRPHLILISSFRRACLLLIPSSSSSPPPPPRLPPPGLLVPFIAIPKLTFQAVEQKLAAVIQLSSKSLIMHVALVAPTTIPTTWLILELGRCGADCLQSVVLEWMLVDPDSTGQKECVHEMGVSVFVIIFIIVVVVGSFKTRSIRRTGYLT